MRKHAVQRPRHAAWIQRFDEQARVPELPVPHEAPELLFGGPLPVRGLLLVRAEGLKIAVGRDDLLHGGRTDGADQLVLQVDLADVEAEPFHLGASEVGAETGPLETAPEVTLLRRVAEACEREVESPRAEPIEEPSDCLRAPDRHDGDALGAKIPAAARGPSATRSLIPSTSTTARAEAAANASSFDGTDPAELSSSSIAREEVTVFSQGGRTRKPPLAGPTLDVGTTDGSGK
jgi:hypothetical protein